MIVRTNEGYRTFGSIPGYGYHVGIAIPLLTPNVDGLPSPEENLVLGQIEERLKITLELKAESLLVGVITTRNMKEFVFYTRDPEQVRRKVDDLSASISSHRIQLIIERDSNWRVYRLLS